MKKITSLMFAILFSISAMVIPIEAIAAYTTSIKAFTYNGYAIPSYDGDVYEVVNNNNPKFSNDMKNQDIYESYGNLDSQGRVTTCVANIDYTLMPTGERGSISSVSPTGWIQKQYSFINGKYLYNRSHLIGWQLTGENANEKNLMTGTKSFNVDGMLPFENKVADYIKQDKENNVLYRITPVFQGSNDLATGILMEAFSVDDNGAAIKFCVFVYNVQKGVSIDYATGESKSASSTTSTTTSAAPTVKSVKLSSTSYTYNGKVKTPTVTVKNSKGQTLKKGTHYTVTYAKGRKAIGKYSVKVKYKGGYKGSKTLYFTIKPKATTLSSVTAGTKKLTVKWKKQASQTTGYQIQYSTSSKFSDASIVTVSKNSTTSKTISKLKAGKKYYVN